MLAIYNTIGFVIPAFNTLPKRDAFMRNKLRIQLILGIAFLAAAFFTMLFHVLYPILTFVFLGNGIGQLTSWYVIRKHTREDKFVYDEMTRRIDALSGWYTSTITLFSLLILMIINYFFPLQIDTSWLLLSIALFMSLLYIVLRSVLATYGKAE